MARSLRSCVNRRFFSSQKDKENVQSDVSQKFIPAWPRSSRLQRIISARPAENEFAASAERSERRRRLYSYRVVAPYCNYGASWVNVTVKFRLFSLFFRCATDGERVSARAERMLRRNEADMKHDRHSRGSSEHATCLRDLGIRADSSFHVLCPI